MSKWTEIESLRNKLTAVVKMEDRDKRALAGKYLERECRNLDDEYNILASPFDDKAAIELRAIVQVIFDYVLFDDLEDKDWQGAFPTSLRWRHRHDHERAGTAEEDQIMHPQVWEKEMNVFMTKALDGQNIQISVGDEVLEVQVASSEESHKVGLSLHDHLPFSGMLFMYAKDNTAPFTRADMTFPIDIRFFDKEGSLIKTCLYEETEIVAECHIPYRYVLETGSLKDLQGTSALYSPLQLLKR